MREKVRIAGWLRPAESRMRKSSVQQVDFSCRRASLGCELDLVSLLDEVHGGDGCEADCGSTGGLGGASVQGAAHVGAAQPARVHFA